MKKSKAFWSAMGLSILCSISMYAVYYSFVKFKWWEHQEHSGVHALGWCISAFATGCVFYLLIHGIARLIIRFNKIAINSIKKFNNYLDDQ